MAKRVLIVDDDIDYCETIRERLEQEGYEVILAHEGLRGVEFAIKKKPDLILLDWKMPAGGGSTVLHHLRSRLETREIPVIVITGVHTAGLEDNSYEEGATVFFEKPCDMVVVLKTMKELLQKV